MAKQRRAPRKSYSTDSFYRTQLWRGISERYRARNPLCERCQERGITTPADLVHHRIPIADGGAKLSADNLKSLCNACHAAKHAKG